MLFHNWTFFIFLAIVLPVFFLLRKTRYWIAWLMLASYFFYGWWNPYYLSLVFYSTVLDYFLVTLMDRCPREGANVDVVGRLPRLRFDDRVLKYFFLGSTLAVFGILAPTFLEAAGLPVPATMTARSLLPVLLSDKSGQVDPTRDHTLTGMERHDSYGRSDGSLHGVGYPMRTLITKDFHYIRNFKPNRWPAGNPPAGPLPSFEKIADDTFVAFSDWDKGPTKAFMVLHRDDAAVKPFYERACGKRPARELYDLRNDPFELKNVAEDPAYADTVKELDARLMAELTATNDPRATGGGDEFDHYPSTQPKRKSK